MEKIKALLTAARAKVPFLDHLVRMFGRYQADTGDRLAAAVTFYWFLSLFPILLVAIAITGYVLGDSAAADISKGLKDYLPAQLASTIGDVVQNSKGKAGVIGLLGTLLSGLGWIDGLREAIRTIWHQNVQSGNVITRKIFDIGILLGLFAVIAASVVATGLVSQGTKVVLDLLGLGTGTAATVFTKVLGYALTGAVDMVMFLYLFSRLARVRTPVHRLLRGALLGAVGLQVLNWAGAFYVARTTSKGAATYGTFAVVVGLLLFLNLLSRLILYTAAFVVTAPYDSDVAPSGTADAEQARLAGIPVEYADADPDNPPVLQEGGAPTPLRAAVQGKTPPQDEPEGRPGEQEPRAGRRARGGPDSSPSSGRDGEAAPAQDGDRRGAPGEDEVGPVPAQNGRPVPVGGAAAARTATPSLPGEHSVRLAARASAGVLGVGTAAVGVYAVRTLRDVLRR